MGWETRKGTDNRYYTRTRRVDGHLVREYLGNNPKAREAARKSAELRMLREIHREQETKRKLWLADCVRICDEFYELVDVVYKATMAAAGYHYQRGQWRKRRLTKEQRAQEARQQKQAPAEAARDNHKPVRSPRKPPQCRPMPQRPAFDFRKGLVRGGGRNKQSAAPAIDHQQRQESVELGTGALPELRCAGSGLRVRQAQPGKRARAPPDRN